MPYANNNGVRIHYHVEGQGSPLVIQHGFTDSIETWYELNYVDMLRDSHRLILVDARGHGDSDKPHDPEAYRFETMASDVVTILDELAIPKAHFFGFSMGGRIAFSAAKFAPERFHSLIIGASNPYRGNLEARDRRLQDLKKGAEVIATWLDAPVSQSIRDRLVANDVDAIAALSVQSGDAPSMEDVLPSMKMPCLLIVGEDDGNYPRALEYMNQIPNASLVSLPGLNHVGTILRSDLIVPHVLKFLAEVDVLVSQ